MDEVKINWHCPGVQGWPPSTTYNNYRPQFSWASSLYKGEATQLTCWHGCRETFTSEVRRCFNPAVRHNWKAKKDIDTRRTRVLVLFKKPDMKSRPSLHKEAETQIKEAVRVLNIIERHMKWPKSKAFRVKDDSKESSCFLLTGSGKWMISPQLVSLYLLIVRLCEYDQHTSAFKKFTAKDFAAIAKSSGYSRTGDFGFYRGCYVKLPLFFDNFDKLFGESTIKDNFLSWGGSTGINDLMSCANKAIPKHHLAMYHPAIIKFRKVVADSKKKKA